MKYTIEIECPEGYKPVYNENLHKVEIIVENSLGIIDSFENAARYLDIYTIACGNALTIDTISHSLSSKYKCNIINIALHKAQGVSIPSSLTKGAIYYPHFSFCLEEKVSKEEKNVVGAFKYEGNKYFLIGTSVCTGLNAGFGALGSHNGLGIVATSVGFFPCATREITEYFFKNFAELYFDAIYGDNIEYQFIG